MLQGSIAKEHFSLEYVGFHKGMPFRGDRDVAFLQCRKTKQHGSLYDG